MGTWNHCYGDICRATKPDSSAAEEVAELIWYLAQDRATPITGANLSIDFGVSAGV
jgi:NAD(P)-dependent dehydrogenase (short-subunit alcohol dehydrogenase family)